MEAENKTFIPLKKRKRAFEEVALNIKEAIFEGVWEKGDRLPAENELASQFGVSRHTIREALRTLELSGLIAIRTGVSGGPIVKDRITSSIESLFSDAFQIKNISIDELTAARVGIEKVILDNLFDNIDDECIKELKDNIKEAEQLISQKKIATENNFEFHSLMAKASNNKVFILLEKMIGKINRELRSHRSADLKTSSNAVETHKQLLDAILKKQKKKAHKLLEDHIRGVADSYTS